MGVSLSESVLKSLLMQGPVTVGMYASREFTSDPIRTKSTVLELKESWREDGNKTQNSEDLLRKTNVYFQSEELELAEVPIQEFSP